MKNQNHPNAVALNNLNVNISSTQNGFQIDNSRQKSYSIDLKGLNMNRFPLSKAILPLTVMFSLWANPVMASGPGSTGGGNTERTSMPQLETMAHDTRQDLFLFLYNYQMFQECQHEGKPNCGEILGVGNEDKRFLTIANTIVEKTIASNTDKVFLEDSIQYKFSSECFEDRTSVSGSAVIGNFIIPMCLSTVALQALPPNGVKEQLMPLMGHELAHQAGYLEQDAKFFATYIKYKKAKDEVKRTLEETKASLVALKASLRVHTKATKICAMIGNLTEKTHGMFDKTFNFYDTDDYVKVDDAKREQWIWFDHLVLENYCGFEDPNEISMAKYGRDQIVVKTKDKRDLFNVLNQMDEHLSSLNELLDTNNLSF